jgi:hypothetical protein
MGLFYYYIIWNKYFSGFVPQVERFFIKSATHTDIECISGRFGQAESRT